MVVEYSKRLGRITLAQFQAALTRVDLGTFLRAEAIVGGLFGQNVSVTSTNGAFVLRDRLIVWEYFQRHGATRGWSHSLRLKPP